MDPNAQGLRRGADGTKDRGWQAPPGRANGKGSVVDSVFSSLLLIVHAEPSILLRLVILDASTLKLFVY